MSEVEQLRRDNEGLRKENAELRARVQELSGRLEAAIRAGKRQAAPFRRKKRKTNPKKPGREPGHKGSKRETPPKLDRTLEAPALESCPNCGGELRNVRTYENFETDIPPVQPTVTRFLFEGGVCTCCGQEAFSRHPEQTSTAIGAAASHLGPRVMALVADLKMAGMPYRKIVEHLRSHYGIEVTAGALVGINYEIAARAEPTIDAIKEALADESVAHADETGWRVDGESWWLWVVCSTALTLYEITDHRRATIVADVLGEDFAGLLMRDGWASYDTRLGYQMLRCLLHLRHNAEKLLREQSGDAALAPQAFLDWLDDIFELRKRVRNGEVEPGSSTFREEAASLVTWFDLFTKPASHDHERNQRFVNRLAQARDHIVPIVERPELPATNCLAERQIRPAVVARKISAGNKSERGASMYAQLASLAATARQNGVAFVDVVRRLLVDPRSSPLRFWTNPVTSA